MKHLTSWLIAAIVCAGCSGSSSSEQGSTETKLKPRIPVERNELTFADPQLAALFERLEQAAKTLTDDSFEHQPYWTKRGSRTIETHWVTPGPVKKTSGGHSISLTAFRDPAQPKTVIGIALGANWRPEQSGWGANVRYFQATEEFKSLPSSPSTFSMEFRWHPDGKFQHKTPAFEIFRHVSHVHVTRVFDDTKYGFGASIEPSRFQVRISDNEVNHWLLSGETLRAEILNRLDQLETRAKQKLSSGQGISANFVAGRNHSSVDSISRLAHSLPQTAATTLAAIEPPESDRPLSEEEKALLFQDVLQKIDSRRNLVNENHQEWFAALQQVFPLRECLTGSHH